MLKVLLKHAGGLKSVRSEEKRLIEAQKNLTDARKVLDEAYDVADYTKMKKYDEIAKESQRKIRAMQKAAKVKPLTKEETKELNKLVKTRDKNLNLKKEIEFNRY